MANFTFHRSKQPSKVILLLVIITSILVCASFIDECDAVRRVGLPADSVLSSG